MKNILVRTAIVTLFAAGTLSALSAAPTPDQPKKPDTPIPICYQCGHLTASN